MKKNEIIFVLGGCRSGKSSYALRLGEDAPGNRKYFIATCVPLDDEMKERVALHRLERSRHWITLEIPIDIHQPILDEAVRADVVLIDCITIWVSNMMLKGMDCDAIIKQIQLLTDALDASSSRVILVSNEIGCGVVPENALARQFRDIIGIVNQKIAACADTVIWVAAGIPMVLKQPKDSLNLSTR